MLRTVWILVRLRLRRLVNALSVGFRPRKIADGARRATAPKTRSGFAVVFGGLMLLSSANLAYQTVARIDRYLGRMAPGAADRGLALELALLLAATLLLTIGTKELSAPEWDLEWLATLPIPLRNLLVVRIAERTIANPTGILVLLPFLSIVAFERGAGLAAPVYGVAIAVSLLVMLASLRTVVDTGLRLVLSPPQLRNLQAVISIAAIVPLYLALSTGTGGQTFVADAAVWLPSAANALPPSTVMTILAGRGAEVVVAAVVLVAEAGLLAFASVALLERLLRDGVVAGGARESARAARRDETRASPSKGALRERRLLTAIQARDLRLLSRDRTFLVQTVVLPLVIFGAQLLFNASLLPSIRQNPAHLGAVAFGIAAYSLMFSALQALNTEGPSLWILYTVPQSLESVLRDKTRLWSAVASVYPLLLLGGGLALGRTWSLSTAAIALIVLVGVPIHATIAASLGVFACDPLAQEVQRRVRVGYMYVYMLLASIYGYAIYASSVWQRIALMTLSALLGLALWQKARDHLPFLLDPSAQPKPRVSLSDGLIAALVFFVLQALVAVVAAKVEAPVGPALLIAFGVAGAITFAAMRFAFWRSRSGDVPRILSAGVPRALLVAVAAAAVASSAGIVYLAAIRHFGWLDEAKRQGTVQPEALGPWLFALAVLAAPVFEEFIFRGLIFGGLRRSVGLAGAAFASAAIFAVVHPPISVAPVFCLGLCTAIAYERTRMLLAPMTVHAIYNAVVLVFERSL